MGTRQEQFSGTRDVRSAHQFDVDVLNEYMMANVSGFSGPLTVKQFKGGQSNPTYRRHVATACGVRLALALDASKSQEPHRRS